MRPPFETFTRPICKGSYALGSACGICEKCIWEREHMGIRLEVADREPHDNLRELIDVFFKHQGCPANECGEKIVIDRISARELVDKALSGNSRREALSHAVRCLDVAKRQPAHSPTEDALIDALDTVVELLRSSSVQ